MQYHPWGNRREVLDLDDEAVKVKFRAWIGEPMCPWYARENYLAENNRRLRGVGKDVRRGQPKQERMSRQAYEEEIHRLVNAEDYTGAARLKATYEMQAAVSEEDLEEEEEEESSAAEEEAGEINTRILKLLYKGNMEEVAQSEQQARKSKITRKRTNPLATELLQSTRRTDLGRRVKCRIGAQIG